MIRPAGLKQWKYGFTNFLPTPHGIRILWDRTYTLSVSLKADRPGLAASFGVCLLYTSDAADDDRIVYI